ncbi:hypothetical protein BC833DRAFT_596291 [Globomyces pollinis-pini]|nr:hypothetical protein BC833DRAFT_596291 [Globomyces pollinis-pini]
MSNEEDSNNDQPLQFRPKYINYAETSADMILLMDLDAYNYISVFLFQGMGTEDSQTETLDLHERLEIFRDDLLSNTTIFQVLKKPEILPLSTLKRLNIATALLAIEELTNLRASDLDSDNQMQTHTIYKRMASCYARLVEFLMSDCLSLSEKSEKMVKNLFVEFKTLQFLADISAGYLQQGQLGSYVTEEARNIAAERLSISVLDCQNFDSDAVTALKDALTYRKDLIYEWIATGEVTLDPTISIKHEQELIKCLISISIAANSEMAPILHPVYHKESSPKIQQSTKLLVERLRKSQSDKQKQDSLGGGLIDKKRRAVQIEEGGQRTRRPWTEEETRALEEGIEQYGNDWVTIHKKYINVLKDRDPVKLKDRARSMRRILTRAQKPLGVWGKNGQ